MRARVGGIGPRIAAAALVVAAVATVILAFGVVLVGGRTFADLMIAHGEPVEAARSMFQESVVEVVVVAAVAAVVAAVLLAGYLGRRLAAPLRDMGGAAHRIAAGDLASRIPTDGPEEIASLAASFNTMAGALEEQERMRREFIANAAHELRTPLTNLKGYLEALRDGVIPADQAAFESLLEEAERLVRLARSLDTLSATDAGVGPPAIDVDLPALIRTAVDLGQPALRAAGLELELHVQDTLLVRGDPDMLAQVLGNLLQNATRYTPRGGRITVTAVRRATEALVTVTNTGEAIPAADLPHVFDRFYRVDKSRDVARGGAGIGLAIVRQIVEAAGGLVGVESGEGLTRFWFSLPA